MQALHSFFLARPPMPTDAKTIAAFEALYERALKGGGAAIDYYLAAPKWQFLCYLADTKNTVLHGSGNPDIKIFEPRKSDDVNAFGDRKAVYAASDGLWPMYFAILDRDRYPMSLINSSARIDLGDGRRGEPFYFFSITDKALAQRPYRQGTIYLLPRDTFEQQQPERYGDQTIHLPQWASLVPVKPLAKLSVGPEDFPLLSQMRGHDDETTFARARANPADFPWVEGEAAAPD
ncbi:MAG: hypothetical protein ABI377_08705 [Devosia sp.]